MNPTTDAERRTVTNPLKVLAELGQSVWLDYIRRGLVAGGELARLIEEDDVRGVTSNPAIFENAIAGSTDYDDTLRALLGEHKDSDSNELYERLAIADIQGAADALQSVYDRTMGEDGYVSMEVSPLLASDTERTVREARRLWTVVDRPNLMIKVPATSEGIPAVERLLADGINVNITLMFSMTDYEAVAQAYIRGLERCSDPSKIASVASFFVSRVDTAVDRELERVGTPQALALRGTIAVANAKSVYRRFRQIFEGPTFAELRHRGARVQRVLWASTGTKNPAYSDVLYVEELIGSHTVNTMPPATLSAFRDHGRAQARLEEDLGAVDSRLAQLADIGVDLDAITERLQEEGVSAFADSFKALLAALDTKRRALLSERVAPQRLHLGPREHHARARLEAWHTARVCRRIWQKDPTVWSSESEPELANRLGWLDLPAMMRQRLDDLDTVAEETKNDAFRHIVLLGMGGSSLAPEVFAETFGAREGYPELLVLDSTHPVAVSDLASRIDPGKTLFVVSSKSGTTLETMSLFRAFWSRVSRERAAPGVHFMAITDPGTPLEELARHRGFRRVWSAPPTVGGRYSALSVFGLVPAALIGVDVRRLLDRARRMAEASSCCVEGENAGMALGAALGELAVRGLDKVTFLTSPGLAAFPAWLEQLIAESTGKDGKGLVPVASEPEDPPASYGDDRVFVLLSLNGDAVEALERQGKALQSAGHPVISIRLADRADLGQEMFRWEMAVSAASVVLGIHPFNQPDVQLAKDLARKAMVAKEAVGDASAASTVPASDPAILEKEINRWAVARPGDYVSVQAYLAPNSGTTALLQDIRAALGNRSGVASTLGYGPRFLHSTGQLHKGGPDTGLFLQIVDEPPVDVPVPETDYTFGELIRAQALGDHAALLARKRRVLRVNLGSDTLDGLATLRAAIR